VSTELKGLSGSRQGDVAIYNVSVVKRTGRRRHA